MPFPDANAAVAEEAKVRDYLLDVGHADGGPKAVWFLSLGYSRDRWEELATDLLAVALADESYAAKPSPFGVKYETRGMIGRPGHRPGAVLAVWIIEGNAPPRLITAHHD